MVDNPDNGGPLVKLAVELLDDDHGITEAAWKAFIEVCKAYYGTRTLPPLLEKIMGATDGSEGRVFLEEGWNEVQIPVIGTLKADGQVEFNPFGKE